MGAIANEFLGLKETISSHLGLSAVIPESRLPPASIDTVFTSLRPKQYEEGITLDPLAKQQLYNRFIETINNPAAALKLKNELSTALNNNRLAEFSEQIQHLIIFTDLLSKGQKNEDLKKKIDLIAEQLKAQKNPYDSTPIPKALALTQEEIDQLRTFPYISAPEWCAVRDTLMNLGLTESLSSKNRVCGSLFEKSMNFIFSQYQLSRFLDRSAPLRMGDLIYLEKTKTFIPSLDITETIIPPWGLFIQQFGKDKKKIEVIECVIGKTEEGGTSVFPQGSISLQERLNRKVFRLDFNAWVPKDKVAEVEEVWRDLLGENHYKDNFSLGILDYVEPNKNIWSSLFKKNLMSPEKQGKPSDSSVTKQQEEKANTPSGTLDFKEEASSGTVNINEPSGTLNIKEDLSHGSVEIKESEGTFNIKIEESEEKKEPEKMSKPESKTPEKKLSKTEELLTKVYTFLGPQWIEKLAAENPEKMSDESLQTAAIMISLVALKLELEQREIALQLPDLSKVNSSQELYATLNSFLEKRNALRPLTTQAERLMGMEKNFNNANVAPHEKDKNIPSLEAKFKAPPYIKDSVVPAIASLATSQKGEEAPKKMEVYELAQKSGQQQLYQFLYENKKEGQFVYRQDFIDMIKASFDFHISQNEEWADFLQQEVESLNLNPKFQQTINNEKKESNLALTWNLVKNDPTQISLKNNTLVPISGGMGGANFLIDPETQKKFSVGKPNVSDLMEPANTKQCISFIRDGAKNPKLMQIRPQLKKVIQDTIVDSNFYIREGITPGLSAQNEALGYRLALLLGLDHITPFTCAAIVESPDLKMASDIVSEKDAAILRELEPAKRKFISSIQPFIDHSESLDSYQEKTTETLKIQKIPDELIEFEFEKHFNYKNIFHILFLEGVAGECDPNTGNYLVITDPENLEKKKLLKIDNALIFSTLHSDFSNKKYSNVTSLPLFSTFPNFVNAPIPEEEKKTIKEMHGKKEEIKQLLRNFKKSEEVIKTFEERMDMMLYMTKTYSDVTLKDMFRSLGSDKGGLEDRRASPFL